MITNRTIRAVAPILNLNRTGLRIALLGSAAMSGVFFAMPTLAQAQVDLPTDLGDECVLDADGVTITCSGDLSDGVNIQNGSFNYSNLIIDDLEADITPGYYSRGVNFYRTNGGDVTVTIDTGDFAFVTDRGTAIRAQSRNGTEATVSVVHSGDIIVNDGYYSYGIRAAAQFNDERNQVSIQHDGDITVNGYGYSDGLLAFAFGKGSQIEIVSSGDFVVGDANYSDPYYVRGSGITAYSEAFSEAANGDRTYFANGAHDPDSTEGDIYVRHDGDITSYAGRAITASASYGGDVTIRLNGDVTRLNDELEYSSILGRVGSTFVENGEDIPVGNGNVDIRVVGDIENQSAAVGIIARALRGGSVSVYQRGDITVQAGNDFNHGIAAESGFFVYSEDLIDELIEDGWHMDVDVTHIGTIETGNPENLNDPTLTNNEGVRIAAWGGHASLEQTGDVSTYGDDSEGLQVETRWRGDIYVAQTGTITTRGANSDGIQTLVREQSESLSRNTQIIATSEILTDGFDAHGIRATSEAHGDISIALDGSITTSGALSHGIYAHLAGDGDIDITTDGEIATELGGHGVYARTSGAGDIRINAGAIDARGLGSAQSMPYVPNGLNLVLGGDGQVAATLDSEIYGEHTGVFIQTAVEESFAADQDQTVSLIVSDMISGGAGFAMDLTNVRTFVTADQTSLNGADIRLEIQPGYGFAGIVDARNADFDAGGMLGDNTLVFGGDEGEATFDLSEISADLIEDEGEVYFGFQNFLQDGSAVFNFTGQMQDGLAFNIAALNDGLAVLAADTILAVSGEGGPLTIGDAGLASLNAGGTIDGDLLLGENGFIALSNLAPIDPIEALDGADDVFTVTGNFQSAGGAVYLDLSTSGESSDTLIIGGAATGTTNIYFDTQGATPGLTAAAPTDGILVVDTGEFSSGTFQLATSWATDLFTYELVNGNGEDWYLQSTGISGSGLVYPYAPYSLRTFGRQLNRSFADRYGHSLDMAAAAEANKGFWSRVSTYGSEADGPIVARTETAVQTFGAAFDEDITTAQFGVQTQLKTEKYGLALASLFVQLGSGETQIDDTHGLPTGKLETEMYGVGGGLSLITDKGCYLDGTLTASKYDVSTVIPELANRSTDGYVWTLGGEVGTHYALNSNLALIPNAQVLYQNIILENLEDGEMLPVNTRLTESLEGRVGSALVFSQSLDSGTLRWFGEGNVVEEFGRDPVTVIDNTQLDLEFDETSYDLGLGVEYLRPSNALALSLDGGYRAPFEQDGIETWT